MKTSLKIVALLFVSFHLFGQVEFAPVGASWVLNVPTNPHQDPIYDPLLGYFELTSEGDVDIDGKTYRKVGDYFFYQDGYNVYYLWEGEDRLVYKYDLEVGEFVTFQLLNCEGDKEDVQLKVAEIKTVNINGESLLRYNFDHEIRLQYDYSYTEKYGSERTLVEDHVDCSTVTGADMEWLRCYKDNDMEYKTDKFINLNGDDCYYSRPSSINEYQNISISLFPNPAQGFIEIMNTSNHLPAEYNIQIISLSGKILSSQKNITFGNRLNVSNLSSGIYIVQLIDTKGQLIFKDKINVIR